MRSKSAIDAKPRSRNARSAEIGGGLRQIGCRCGELGVGAFGLQLQVLRVEPRHDVAGVNAVADIDDARDDLAGDAEAEIGLIARPHHADEFARGVFVFKGDALHLHRPFALDRGRGLGLAAGEEQHIARAAEASWDVRHRRSPSITEGCDE